MVTLYVSKNDMKIITFFGDISEENVLNPKKYKTK